MAESNEEMNDDDIIINAQDGLPNVHPNLMPEQDMDEFQLNADENDEFEGLPASLIVTNIPENVFYSQDKKHELENLFKSYDSMATFQWLKSFRRLRVNFQTPLAAATARIELHQCKFNDCIITCYFAQPVTPVRNTTLKLPAPYKQFLISPPASPPLDWAPRLEGEPMINHDLLAALANLSPGGSHEIHPPSPGQPSIILHSALGLKPNNNNNISTGAKPKIIQTACPNNRI